MQLSVGDRLGPYKILAAVGKGGMGEVYRARDPRLNRDVAIKVSSQQFTDRFEREARAIAALNHPHICHIYDVGPNYLVMELFEGRGLKGPLPIDRALAYAAQICDALDAAHKKGITHRDLKPANILVTTTGIKLLDFGLAKFASAATRQAGESTSNATFTMPITNKNEIVGTLYYMSPEQLHAQSNGQKIDARSDIFSFGLVLYEMLTGKRAFNGASQASVIAAILEREAPSVTDVAPAALDRLLKRCLAKDPEARWQSVRDLKAELEWIATASTDATTVPAGRMRRIMPWIAAGVLAISSIAAGVGWYRSIRPRQLKPLVRLDVDLGSDVSLGASPGADAILSPDATRMVYVSHGKLFSRKLDQLKASELGGTEGAYSPFFSPDGQSIAFFAGGKLKTVSVEGGAPVQLCDATNGRGGTWAADGNIIAALNTLGALSRISSTGGALTHATELAPGEVTHRWPQVLPAGKALLFTSSTTANGYEGATIEILSLKDRRRKTLLRGGTFGRYLAVSDHAGYLLYMNSGRLFAVAFDLDSLDVRGTPVPVLEQVAYNPANGSAKLDFAASSIGQGLLIFRGGGAIGAGLLVTVQWLESNGKRQPLLAKPGAFARPRLSPDGRRLGVEKTEGRDRDIWIYEWARDTMTRLTFDAGVNSLTSAWSPDGRYILFPGRGGIFWIRSDGAGKPQLLIQNPNIPFPTSFRPDGKRLLFTVRRATGARELWTVPLDTGEGGLRAGKPEPFLQDSFDSGSPVFSPDGRWVAYVSNESGTYQVYVRAFPDRGGKWQISNAGGDFPVWSSNGRELFFLSNDNRIMVATYTVKVDSIVADQPKVWSEQRLADFANTGIGSYDLAPDGKRIAALMPVEKPEEQQAQNHVIFVENFLDELRKRLPTGK